MRCIKYTIIGIMILMVAIGCKSNKASLNEEINFEALNNQEVTKIQVVKAMGNPIYGAESKIVEDQETLKEFVSIFNNAKIVGKVAEDEIVDAGVSRYYVFKDEEIIHTYGFNGNDSTRIWIDYVCYYVEYQGKTPYELYEACKSLSITVNEDLRELKDEIPVATNDEISVYLDFISDHGGYGAEPPRLLYASQKMAIIHNISLVFYDIKAEKIVNVLDCKAITQPDASYDVFCVSQDGKTISSKSIDQDSQSFISAQRYDVESHLTTAISEVTFDSDYENRFKVEFLEESDSLYEKYGGSSIGHLSNDITAILDFKDQKALLNIVLVKNKRESVHQVFELLKNEVTIKELDKVLLELLGHGNIIEDVENIDSYKELEYFINENVEFTINSSGDLVSYSNREDEETPFGELKTLDEVISKLKFLMDLQDGYQEIISDGISEDYIWITWEKEVIPGVFNPYDCVKVHMNKETLKVENIRRFLDKVTYEEAVLTNEEAIIIANNSGDNTTFIKAHLSYIKAMPEYLDSKEVRLAYIVQDQAESHRMWVDAISGEILGEDETK